MLLALAGHVSVHAQSSATGTVEGRVFNPATGEYLELARITVEGTALETFTDATGRYRLGNVPAGTARVQAFRTGVAAQTLPVIVAEGETALVDFSLGAPEPGARSLRARGVSGPQQ